LKLESVNFENIPKKTINDERIEDIISKLISDGFHILDNNGIVFEIIKYTKCDQSTANDIISRMNELGLGICYHFNFGYSIRRFANMRGYISDSELEQLNRESLEKIREINPKIAQFMKKHGVDKTEWSDEVADEYEYGIDT